MFRKSSILLWWNDLGSVVALHAVDSYCVCRGCLFYGPPGTGKTLVARALANECSQGERKVSFFMRKGADCLSKWVGESERQLRLLFDQVITYHYSPWKLASGSEIYCIPLIVPGC